MKNHLNRLMLIALLLPATVMAGGIVTNTNQSASFIRNPSQDAVINATGTYFNPAGLAFLSDGFHFSLSNQIITQTRTINSTFPGLATKEFEGGVFAPIFPNVYAVYKTGSLALSLGVNPIGGGGSANFEKGLPSFDQNFATFTNTIAGFGINSSYGLDAAFDGSSLNWGFQLNGSYAINDVLSFSLGLRYITANNSYKGHLRNVMINPVHPLNPAGSGNMVTAPSFFNTLSGAASMAATGLQPIIDGGIGGLTLNQLVTLELMNSATAAQIKAGLPGYTDAMTVSQIQTAYNGLSAQMAGVAALTQSQFGDREVDATQSGTGISPIFGVNIKFSDDLNFAVKYEHKAKITLKNTTTVDDVGMFPDGVETAADMPSMLAMGLNYRALPALSLSGGFHYYFDKGADYGKKIGGIAVTNEDVIDKNFWEAAFGIEYALSRSFLISVGYLRTQTGVNDAYHSDLSHSLSTNSIGCGFRYMINPSLGLNLGVMTTMYEDYTKSFATPAAYDETYSRKALTFGLGIDFRL
jgi:long-chain fatty acid transport protein